jgi:hypothetical protein
MDHELQFANQIVTLHGTLASQLTALWLRRRLAGTTLTPRALTQLRVQSHAAAIQFVRAADAQTVAQLAQLSGAALADARLTGRGVELVGRLRAIAFDETDQLVARARGAGLKGALSAPPAGALARLLVARDERINFTAHDSAGRRWPADRLVRFLARDFAYQAGIDAAAARLATVGDLAQVVYPNPAHEHHGLLVSLSGATPAHPSLAQVRSEIFHPNASARLQHVSPHL